MYIGIYDQDLLTSKKLITNLDTMQISSYHKHNHDIVELIIQEDEDLSRFDKIYYVKNINDRDFLTHLINNKKVETVGVGFTNGKIKRILPYFYSQPDKSIFNKYFMKNYKNFDTTNKERKQHFDRYEHIRLNYGNGKAEPQWEIKGKNVFIHDPDIIHLEGAYEYCNQFAKILFRHFNYTTDLETAIKWTKPKWFHSDNRIYYRGKIEDKQLKKHYATAEKRRTPIYWYVDIDCSPLQSRILFKDLLNKILFLETHSGKLFLVLENENNNFFYRHLLSKLRNWNNNRKFGKTFKEFYSKPCKKKDKQIFDKMCELDYNIKKMVNVNVSECRKKGGVWNYVDGI